MICDHKAGRVLLGGMLCMSLLSVRPAPAQAQWVQISEQFYLPADHNWQFRKKYAAADRLFNAFDYGHGILYETLYRFPDAPVSRLEEKEYDFITRKLLVNPPHVPLEEAAIEVAYAKLVPEAKAMFEWAHLLHRQIYDVWSDERIPVSEKDARVAELIRYYKTRPDLAFSSIPKSMELMDGQDYSLAFRQRYPKFNGLIWAYHWLQVGLYEPLMTGRNLDERQALVTSTVARFRQMLERPPESMPYLMPMTPAVAPTFAARYPEASIIFDNLHMMHDVVSDVLASEKVPRNRKRAEILRAAELFRDASSYVVSEDEWRSMAVGMGAHNMGGVAVGFVTELPKPTVERGMSMAGMSEMPGLHQAPGTSGMTGMQHGATEAAGVEGNGQPGDTSTMKLMMQIHERMMSDPVIRERMQSDPVLQRMMAQMPDGSAGAHAEHVMSMTAESGVTESPQLSMAAILDLLADPEIAGRIRSDERLRALWEDADVQQCVADLRRIKADGQPLPIACPSTVRQPTGQNAEPAHRQH